MPSLFDMDYGTVRKGTARLSGREAPRATPSLWDYINAVSMTPVPGVSDVAAGLLAAKDFREGNYGSGALNAAGLIPFVPALGGIFKGVKGATKAEKQALLKAQQMAREGADRDTIWNATLWYKGKDGKWRTELSDRDMRLTGPVQDYQQADLDQLITHPGGMFESAPYLRQTDVELTKGGRGASGEYIDRANKIKVTAPEDHPMRSGILHEAQHSIQQREGMARGGSPEAMSLLDIAPPGLVDSIKRSHAYRLQVAQGRNANDALEGMLAPYMSSMGNAAEAKMEAYKRLLGEVDARNTQKRMDMTLDQRREFPPWSTWDVPEEQQIVRFGDGPAMSITDTSMDDLAAQLEAMRAANKAKGLPVETGTGDIRNEIARRNAVGLLGLPETNTAADRARAMGFTGDVFHGSQTTTEWTQNPDLMRLMMEGQDIPAGAVSSTDAITEFRTRPGGLKMFDFAVHAGTPEAATDRLRTYHGIKSAEKYAPQLADAYVMPLLINESKPLFDSAKSESAVQNALAKRAEKLGFGRADTRHYSSVYPTPARMKQAQKAVANQLKEEGITNIPYINSHEARGSISQAILDPRNIRSRFAAFDPARRDEADLLAGLLPYAIPAGLLGMFLTRPGEGYE